MQGAEVTENEPSSRMENVRDLNYLIVMKS